MSFIRNIRQLAQQGCRMQCAQFSHLQYTRNTSYKLGNKPRDYLHEADANPLVIKAYQTNQATRVLFDNQETVDFKNIWLRDNCKCPQCVDSMTFQKMLDTPSLELDTQPDQLKITEDGNLIISWRENNQNHVSTFNSEWLYRYGQIFTQENFETSADDLLPKPVLWDRNTICGQLPEISHREVTETESGLKTLLEMICKYGIAILRNVPPAHGKILEVVRRFAYAKETQYGLTFDVVNEPDPTAHPAFSGLHLHLHTDMNYREASPGIQILHCLKAMDLAHSATDPGGLSFFVDGFHAAQWIQENSPEAFLALTSTPIRFQILNKGKEYSKLWPIISTDQQGNIFEIHYNNRTMGTLKAPSNSVVQFYEAYKMFTDRIRQSTAELRFRMVSGDLVVFNNRRILHGRTSFDPQRVSRHLVGCYADIDEVMSTYKSLVSKPIKHEL